jgi:hypothetical protein
MAVGAHTFVEIKRLDAYCAERASSSQNALVSHAALAGADTLARTESAIRADIIVFMSRTPLK